MHTKFKNLTEVFLHHVGVPVDRNLLAAVLTYTMNFVRKDEDSISFFGSPLLGVYPVKFTTEDKLLWIEDVLQINDFDQLRDDIYDLPDIDKTFNVSSDAVNLSFCWVAYQALISTTLTLKEREALAKTAIDMLQYKFISSIHTRSFPHRANIEISMAVYENLDNKSQLKRAGSWKGLVDIRTADILGPSGLHANTIRTLQTDYQVVKMLNDIWSRMKSIFRILNDSFYTIRDTTARIASTDKFTQVDGEAILKDSVNKYAHIKTHMHDIVPDRNSFVKDELIKIVMLNVNTAYQNYLKDTLYFISQNYSAKYKAVNISDLIDEILMFAFDVIRKDKIELNNLPSIAIKMRNMLRSSRVVSPEFKIIKEKMGIIIDDANHRITEVNNASTKIAVVLYIVLRALMKE